MAKIDVLVVDDDTATREGLTELLALSGATVDDARDAVKNVGDRIKK